MIEILKTLINIESISGNEENIANHVYNLLENQKGKLKRIGNNIIWKNDWNPDKKTIALGAHLDTVPFSSEEWQVTAPCNAKELNEKIYGRGACDMKAGVAIILDIILNHSQDIKCNMMAFFYEKEELGIPNGVTTLIEQDYFNHIDLCIIPEPTECILNYGVFGNLDAKIIASGKSVHSSNPRLGRNAIYELIPTLQNIQNFKTKTIDGIEEAISVNMIKGGKAINIVPDKVEAKLDYRFDPNITNEKAVDNVKKLMTENISLEIIGIFPGIIHSPEKNKTLQELAMIVGNINLVPFWSDIGQLGAHGILAINYGPGSIKQAHTIDEYVPIQDIKEVSQNILQLITQTN